MIRVHLGYDTQARTDTKVSVQRAKESHPRREHKQIYTIYLATVCGVHILCPLGRESED